ncbi:MAG: hypothetical protein WCW04_01820 [Candidatus Paceibacterota bacterium]
MDLHNIHGTEMGFHHETEGAIKFLKESVHSEAVKGFLDHAKEHGEYHFYDAKGEKYAIKHELQDGKSNFSVEKAHNH